MTRRVALAALGALGTLASGTLVTAGCRRVARCASCGMALDPTSRWYAEVTLGGRTEGFDTPKCALRWRLGPGSGGALSVRGYYGQQKLAGEDVVFAVGSDVLGPMGADLVPVEPVHEAKFRSEHHATSMKKLAELTAALIEAT